MKGILIMNSPFATTKFNHNLMEFYAEWQDRSEQTKRVISEIENYLNSETRTGDDPSPKELLDLFRTNPQNCLHSISTKLENDDYTDNTIDFAMQKHEDNSESNDDEDKVTYTLNIWVYYKLYETYFKLDIAWHGNGNYYVKDFNFDNLDEISWDEIRKYLDRLFYNK